MEARLKSRIAVSLALVLIPAPALAQSALVAPATIAPKGVRTQKLTADNAGGRPLFVRGPDGVPVIDWDLAEQLADGPMQLERTETARLMLAIRDGQWRAMPKSKSFP